MELVIVLVALLAAFDIAAWRWGADSREGIDDAEWQRRQAWPAGDGAAGLAAQLSPQTARPAADIGIPGAGSEAAQDRPAQSAA